MSIISLNLGGARDVAVAPDEVLRRIDGALYDPTHDPFFSVTDAQLFN